MNIDMIRAARDRLKGHARVTPFLFSPRLDELAGRRVFVKAEALQKTGSFKYRGAFAAISALDTAARTRGVISYSSGNHAQGVALAARDHGAPATIVMPKDAPAIKRANTKAYGAEIVDYDRDAGESREDLGAAIQADRGLTFVRPYDEPEVIAGQGTVGLEIIEQAKRAGIEAAEVCVCCGGGGLSAGIAAALAAGAPGLRVRPVEPDGFDDVARSLISGQIETNPSLSGSICDAILTPAPGKLTFPILHSHSGPGVVVSDDDALRAMAAAFHHLNLVLEPGGAVGLAAALYHPETVTGDTVIAVATGGNVDPAVYRAALDRAEALV